jgi:hypothetical protein
MGAETQSTIVNSMLAVALTLRGRAFIYCSVTERCQLVGMSHRSTAKAVTRSARGFVRDMFLSIV